MYASHMPSIPPATLPSNEVRENASAPSRVGIYPPAKEPIIIPSIIIDFRDIVVTKTKVHYHVFLRNPITLSSTAAKPQGFRCQVKSEFSRRFSLLFDSFLLEPVF